MKNFLVFLITLFVAVLYFAQHDLFSRTRFGVKLEHFTSVSESKDLLPNILCNYLAEHNIRYKYHKIPNYIKDFLSKNIDYEIVYKNPSKYTAIFFKPAKQAKKNSFVFRALYNTFLAEKKFYGDRFQLIYKHDLSAHDVYKNPYDEIAFEDLKEYCKYFCLVNPSNDTIFSFKNLTDTETKAIEVLLQQYDSISK